MKQQPRHIFLTGPPRIGKTTIVLKVVGELRNMGLKVGGMISQEIRDGGVRVGFKIMDLKTGLEGILAHIDQKSGPLVGKYRVCLEDLENVGVEAILNACKESDLIIIDEVGPMELHSEAFKKAVLEALNSGKTVLGTIHYRVSSPFIDAIRNREDVEIIEVTYRNRDNLSKTIAKKILERTPKH
ncbi:MAG: NTPase [Candidatus Bathyarchaeia archaeon]|nr:NTPase [Candidatus Bathyarchaeota archaeon]